jgi:hypothetical protein
MQQEVAIKLNLDAGKSVQEVEKIESVLSNIKRNTDVSNVNNQFEKLNSVVDRGGNSVEDLQRAIKSYQTIALTAGRTSPVGKQALQRAANLTDKITDMNNEVKRMANDHVKLQGAMEIGQGVIGSYSAFQGITALVGEENEELMQTMVKLQGAQNAMNGLMQVRKTLEKEKSAMMLIANTRQKIMNGLMIAYNFIIKGTNVALKLFRGALIATGLGALVVLVGTLIAKWDDWKEGIIDFIKMALFPIMPILEAIGLVESENAKIRRLAMEEEREQAKERMKLLDERYKALETSAKREVELAKARGEDTMQMERDNLVEFIEIQKQKLQALVSLRGNIKGMSLEEMEELKEEGEETIKLHQELTHQLEVFDANAKRKREERAKKHYEKLQQQRSKEAEKELKEIDDLNRLKIERQQKFEDIQVKLIEEEGVRKLAQMEINHEREREKLIEKYGKDTELIKALEAQQEMEIDALIKEQETKAKEEADTKREEDRTKRQEDSAEELQLALNQMRFENQQQIKEDRAFLDKKKEMGLLSESDYLKGLKVIDQKKIDLENATRDALIKSREATINATGNALNTLSQMFGENQKIQKAFAIAQVGVDTAKAISSLVAMSSANPANAVTGGTAGAIQYASGIIQIGANMKKVYDILNATPAVTPASFSSPSSVGGSSRSSSGNSDLNNGELTNVGNTNFTDNDDNTTRVVVVESEINAIRMRANRVQAVSSI